MARKKTTDGAGWLVFFYSIPAKPAAGRVKVWRRLAKAGAVQLKGAVYVLPFTEEHYELFQWLASEVAAMDGEAGFIRAARIETMKDAELIAMFDRQREDAYQSIGRKLDETRRKLDAVRNASGTLKDNAIPAAVDRLLREFEEIWKTDFFSSGAGVGMRKRIKELSEELAELAGGGRVETVARVVPRAVGDYQGRLWVTRRRPFIDRMASAWLVRRFIDKDAVFEFADDPGMEGLPVDAVTYDVPGGEFTHVGDFCTFEVIVKSFGLKDKPLGTVAGIVHELDVRDDRYTNPAAAGVEAILSGIRDTASDDTDALERGMAVFEMLYVTISQQTKG